MTNDESKKPDATLPAAPPKRARRKLLAATVGLAFVSMVGAGCTSGNLVSPQRDAGPPRDAGPTPDANDEDAPTGR